MGISRTYGAGGILLLLVLLAPGVVMGGSEGSGGLDVTIAPITEIGLSGAPGTLRVNTATAGLQPDAAVAGGSAWRISTNLTGLKLVGSIDAATPAGITLEVRMGAPGGATSTGFQPLSPVSRDLVVGIGRGAARDLSVQYRLKATVKAAPGPGSRLVTFSVMAQ